MRTSGPSLAMTDPCLTSATNHALDIAMRPNHDDRHDDLREAMRQLCADAHRQGLRPEELIVLFKQTWRTRPEVRLIPREESAALLAQAVTMCIQEYYGASR